MATLKELNIRLASLNNTRKITQAMKLIATTKMNKSVQRFRNSQHYQSSLNQMVRETISGEVDHVLINSKPTISNIKVLLVTSDRGLCGAFNSNLFREFNKFITQSKENDVVLRVDYCGKKGFNFYRKMNSSSFISGENMEGIIKDPVYDSAIEIGKKQIDELIAGDIDEFYLVYNRFESTLIQEPIIKKLAPFDLKFSEKTTTELVYLEPSRDELIDDLLVKNFYFEIFYALLNSIAGENSARMRAMDNATKNCDDMIDSITLQRNRVRQASITKELIEIISGAESI